MTESVIHLLLVEDDEDDYVFTRHLLAEARSHRFEVSWADRLESALNYLNDSSVDVILLDLSLPDSFGWETFTRVRAHVPDVPIVLLTGVQDEELGTKAVHAGAQDYLIKGDLSTQLLTRSITYAIERLRAHDTIQTAYREMESLINQRTRDLGRVQQQLQVETGRRERAEQTLRDGNHLEAVCAFVDSVADRVKGLVGGIRETASTIAKPHPNGHEHREHCDRIIEAADHADTLSSDLASLARTMGGRPPQMEKIEPSKLLRRMAARHKDGLSDQGIMVRIIEGGGASSVRVDREQLGEIVGRALSNASSALPEGGEVHLVISEPIGVHDRGAAAGSGRFVSIDILYAGIESMEPLVDKVLRPAGTELIPTLADAPPGLQIALVQSRVKGWGGSAELIQSDQGSGLRLSLPVSGKELLQQDSVEASRLVENGRVLVVDDDTEVLTMIQSALQQVGYVVEAVPHHSDGLRLLDTSAEGVALVLMDAVMPEKGSAKLMERLSETCPDAAALVMSGFCRDYVQTLIPGKNWSFLQKPFDDEQIIETVNALVRRKFAAQAN